MKKEYIIILVGSVLLLSTMMLIFMLKQNVEKYSSGEHVLAGNSDESVSSKKIYLYFNK